MTVSPLVKTLLEKRGIVGDEAAERFLAPSYERDTHDPFKIWRGTLHIQSSAE